jgi:hypothetical protein
MSRRLALPTFPSPPQQYEVQWASSLIRSLEQMGYLLKNPGEGRMTTLTLTDLPTDDQGLEVGSLFRRGYQVFIVSTDTAFIVGVSGTSTLGSVTVTV